MFYQLTKMKRTNTFKLIDGKFSASEANRLLLDLVGRKIQYHEMENFSSRERFGKDAPHSEKRLKALRKLRNDLKKLFEDAGEKQHQLKIHSNLEIVVVEKKNNKK